MVERARLEIWMAVDTAGDYVVNENSRDDLLERYEESIGSAEQLAVYHLTVDVQLPEAREATIVLADDAPVEIIANVEE